MRASIRFHIESRTRRLVHGIHIDMRFPLSSLSALLQQSRDNVIVFEHFGGFQVFIWFLCPSSWLKVQRWRLNWVARQMLRKLSLRVRRNYVGDLVLLTLNISEPGPHLKRMVGALTRHGFQTLSPSFRWENLEPALSARLLRSPRVGPMSEVQQIPLTQRTSVPYQCQGRCCVDLRKLRCC